LNEFIEAQQKHEEQTGKELAGIEKSRSQLEFQKVYNGRKLENEQRVMQAKFLSAKQELNRWDNSSSRHLQVEGNSKEIMKR
jgi:hypothetical protein